MSWASRPPRQAGEPVTTLQRDRRDLDPVSEAEEPAIAISAEVRR
jgi:hypothetical protein